MILPVIMSGGAGSRLWPLSTPVEPKQLLPLLGERTMIQETAARFVGSDFADTAVICGANHAALIDLQVPGRGAIIVEPVGRNTAPAAAVAALHGQALGAELVLLAPADHHMADAGAFRRAVAEAAPAARNGFVVTFGIRPDRPETGYGYIRMGDAVVDSVNRVDAFVEKPDSLTAKNYIEAGNYAWNAGLFLFRPDTMIRELRAHAPDILDSVESAYAKAHHDSRQITLDPDAFAACRAESVDYAVMEATAHAACLPIDVGWSDIGSFAALHGALPHDPHGNALARNSLAVSSRNCLVDTDGPRVSLVGVEGLGVIVRNNEILVVSLDESQSVKTLVDRIKALK